MYFCSVSIQSSPDNCPHISLNGSTPLPPVGSGTSGSSDSTYNPGMEHLTQAKLVNVLIPLSTTTGLGQIWDWNLEVQSSWSYWQPSGNGGSPKESEIRN